MRFNKPKPQIVCEVDISIMNANIGGLPTGQARCEFMQDGSLNAYLVETQDVYTVGSGTKMLWQFGLMGLVHKDHIYLSIGLGVSAKVVDTKHNQEIELWLNTNHPRS
jgi:hypothetical protein